MDTSSWAKFGAKAGWVVGSQVGNSVPPVELPPPGMDSTAEAALRVNYGCRDPGLLEVQRRALVPDAAEMKSDWAVVYPATGLSKPSLFRYA